MSRAIRGTSGTVCSVPPYVEPGQRERIEMKLAPAPGVEAGALATEMDIVIG